METITYRNVDNWHERHASARHVARLIKKHGGSIEVKFYDLLITRKVDLSTGVFPITCQMDFIYRYENNGRKHKIVAKFDKPKYLIDYKDGVKLDFPAYVKFMHSLKLQAKAPEIDHNINIKDNYTLSTTVYINDIMHIIPIELRIQGLDDLKLKKGLQPKSLGHENPLFERVIGAIFKKERGLSL